MDDFNKTPNIYPNPNAIYIECKYIKRATI